MSVCGVTHPQRPDLRCEQPTGNHPAHFAFDRTIWAHISWPNEEYVEPESSRSRPRDERQRQLNEIVARVRERDRASGFGAGLGASQSSAEGRWTEGDRALVLDAVRRVATRQETFTTDEVWGLLDGAVPVTKGMTAMLTEAKRRGWIESTDTTTIARRGGEHDHAQRLTVWRSKIVGSAPKDFG